MGSLIYMVTGTCGYRCVVTGMCGVIEVPGHRHVWSLICQVIGMLGH